MVTFSSINPFCILLIAYTVTGIEKEDLPLCKDIKNTWYGDYFRCMLSEKCYKDAKDAITDSYKNCDEPRKLGKYNKRSGEETMFQTDIIKQTQCSVSILGSKGLGVLALCKAASRTEERDLWLVSGTQEYGRESNACSSIDWSSVRSSKELTQRHGACLIIKETINRVFLGRLKRIEANRDYKTKQDRITAVGRHANDKCSAEKTGARFMAFGFLATKNINDLGVYFVVLCDESKGRKAARQEMQNRLNDIRELEQELVEMDILRMVFAKQRRDRQERYDQRYDFN